LITKFPKAAELEAVSVKVLDAAGLTLKAVAGEIVTPAGTPETVTETLSENPFKGVIETCKVVEPPGVRVRDVVLGWRTKSGEDERLLVPAAQLTSKRQLKRRIEKVWTCFRVSKLSSK
jgi:hypothetical protein